VATPRRYRSSLKLAKAAGFAVLCCSFLAFVVPGANADCSPGALGTSRVLSVDASAFPRVGRKQFPTALPLARGEFVLTFDDGPWPGTTATVLDALRAQCVRATFFVLGQNATEHPDLLRRELADGHTVAHHTWSHPLLDRMKLSAAEAQIQRGFEAVDEVLYGKRAVEPATPFFRFPGFAASSPLLNDLQRRGIVVFGADLWASDWKPMSPDTELRLVPPNVAGRAWHRPISRHQATDGRHADRSASCHEGPRLSGGPCRAARPSVDEPGFPAGNVVTLSLVSSDLRQLQCGFGRSVAGKPHRFEKSLIRPILLPWNGHGARKPSPGRCGFGGGGWRLNEPFICGCLRS
jgi:peptidoglycan/xylan/chitin deacetylase (PgdA/CDA1 family)